MGLKTGIPKFIGDIVVLEINESQVYNANLRKRSFSAPFNVSYTQEPFQGIFISYTFPLLHTRSWYLKSSPPTSLSQLHQARLGVYIHIW